jgi:hypothetical protein
MKSKTYGVSDLLNRLDVVAWIEFVVSVKELNTRLFEWPLSKKQSLDARQTFVWIVIRLLDERELLTLRLVKTTLDRVSLLQLFECEHKKFCVMLVRQWSKNGEYVACRTWFLTYGNGMGANLRLSKLANALLPCKLQRPPPH